MFSFAGYSMHCIFGAIQQTFRAIMAMTVQVARSLMDISIRPYADDDFDAVSSVWLESWQSTRLPLSTTDTLDDIQERLAQEIAKGSAIYVAETGRDIVGFIGARNSELVHLWVAPALQRKGVGKFLLDFARSQMPLGFWLVTSVQNLKACKFYEKEGLRRGAISIHPRWGHQIVRYDWRP